METKIKNADGTQTELKHEPPFVVLNKINVTGHTEKRGAFTYLSWVYAWTEIMKRYPKSYSIVHEREDGTNYFTDGMTAWVKVEFVIVDTDENETEYKCIEYYPVYNFNHKSIPLENVTSHDVNSAIQRGMTKCIARHGLGLYIYAGEDLPEEEKQENQRKQQEQVQRQKQMQHDQNTKASLKQIEQLRALEAKEHDRFAKMLAYFKVNEIEELTVYQANIAIARLKEAEEQATNE